MVGKTAWSKGKSKAACIAQGDRVGSGAPAIRSQRSAGFRCSQQNDQIVGLQTWQIGMHNHQPVWQQISSHRQRRVQPRARIGDPAAIPCAGALRAQHRDRANGFDTGSNIQHMPQHPVRQHLDRIEREACLKSGLALRHRLDRHHRVPQAHRSCPARVNAAVATRTRSSSDFISVSSDKWAISIPVMPSRSSTSIPSSTSP